VGRIPGDACGIRIESCDDGWCRVTYNGTTGFASAFYLQKSGSDTRRTIRKWADFGKSIFRELASDARWERLGQLEVGRNRDRDVIQLDRRDGRFDALRMRVRGNDVDFRRIVVVYGNGQRDNLDFSRTVGRNDETGELDLRGAQGRFIDRIVLVYRTADRRGPAAEVEIWARKTNDGPARDRFVGFGRDWERLGVKGVDRRRDRDVIQLSRRDGSFDALRLRVLRNDVRIRRVRVEYGNGQSHDLEVDRRLSEGEASDILDLRGRHGRFIDKVTLIYDTVGRGPTAEVELWGRSPRS
jgi:hypothetical protein